MHRARKPMTKKLTKFVLSRFGIVEERWERTNTHICYLTHGQFNQEPRMTGCRYIFIRFRAR